MESYLVQLTGGNQQKEFAKNVLYVGADIEAAKSSADLFTTAVYLHVWNGGILVRTYIKITENYGRDVRWKLTKDYLAEMQSQAAELEKKLSKIKDVNSYKIGHKDDGEGGFYV